MDKKNINNFRKMKGGEPVSWITSYDYPTAYVSEQSNIDMILIGDSGTMCQLGYKTTNLASMEEMILFARAVKRGAPETFCVGDLPQGSYEVSNEEAIRNSLRFAKEAFCEAVKLEGGIRIQDRIKAISDAGILVIAHLGLTPQSVPTFGKYKVCCKTLSDFDKTVEDALAVQKSGASILLLEAMPSKPAEQIAKLLKIPVYGIGAGNKTDGNLVIWHDLMGFYQNFRPWFAKCYIPEVIEEFDQYIKNVKKVNNLKEHGQTTRSDGLLKLAELAIRKYIQEVKLRQYPSEIYTYPIKSEELEQLRKSQYWDSSVESN